MMAPLPRVPCFCTILILLCSLLSSSHARCDCSQSDLDQRSNYTFSLTSTEMDGSLLTSLMNTSDLTENGTIQLPGSLSSYKKNLSSAPFRLSDIGWFFVPTVLDLARTKEDGTILEASFNVLFNLSIYRSTPPHYLVFSILTRPEAFEVVPISGPTSTLNNNVDGVDFTVQIGTSVATARLNNTPAMWVQISIDVPASNANNLTTNHYSVWIDYKHAEHRVWVYIGNAAMPKPENPVVGNVNFTNFRWTWAYFGLMSSMGQLLELESWKSTVDNLHPLTLTSDSHGNARAIILSSVLGSLAATAMTAAAVYYYFNSKYRQWKKEQSKLAKTIQNLPGVPTKVEFVDIRKATKNFNEMMKLGKGGFGAVYRCTLPASASRTGKELQVAVKKFTRGRVEDGRFNDFLSEVSIINRLRHKNIVPLVGWSYNKGDPLLIYEYMTHGSLDQHLFQRCNTRQQREETDIWQWDTRYRIARDIATGLHYVHHEHEPMVLHLDIKASNIMLDSSFHARLGDFGIACTVAGEKSSATGLGGTFGYMAPEYMMSHRATRQTDIYAFGVLILEIVTGKKNADVPADDIHITLLVRRLHREGKLLEAVDSMLILQPDNVDEAKRLLQLGIACTNPNPSRRPSMAEVVQVITKTAPPPEVSLERPMPFGLPEDWASLEDSDYGISVTPPTGSSSSVVELVAGHQGEVTTGLHL